MILVTGANGHLGSQVIDLLIRENHEIKVAALVRSEEKGKGVKNLGAELRIGDYFDYQSLLKAMDGIDTLMFISSGNLIKREEQHANVVKAAKKKGVKHILYTSIIKASELKDNFIGASHYFTEQEILSSGISYTIFRNTFYSEYLTLFLGDALETGQWYYSAGNEKMNLATRTDMAEALSNVLLNPVPYKGKTYEIVASNAYSFSELARAISESIGKKVTYIDIPLEQMREGLIKAGLPEVIVEVSMADAEAIRNGFLNYTDRALQDLLGHKPVDLLEYIRMYFGANVT